MAERSIRTTVPPALSARLNEIHEAHLEGLLCYRRQALLGEACSPPSEQDSSQQLGELAEAVRVSHVYHDGQPCDAGGRPLRPLSVRAESRTDDGGWEPLTGLPLRALQPVGTEALLARQEVSGDDGVARFAFVEGASWPEGLRVAVDGERLLGPLAAMWPNQELALEGRRTSLRRRGLVAMVRVQGQTSTQDLLAASLEARLGQRGIEPSVSLRPEVVRQLQAAPPGRLATMLPELADSWAGRIDVLLRVELDSEFTSPMGAHHMWYEARGRFEAFDVWTGRELSSQEIVATASGVGDERANRAAQSRFAAQLAERLLESLPVEP